MKEIEDDGHQYIGGLGRHAQNYFPGKMLRKPGKTNDVFGKPAGPVAEQSRFILVLQASNFSLNHPIWFLN